MSSDLASHPRLQALSPWARDMYVYLVKHASPLGDVVAMRIDPWVLLYPAAFSELLNSKLLVDYGSNQWSVVMPVQLDQAEILARGDVP